MAGEHLGRRVHHDVGAERERPPAAAAKVESTTTRTPPAARGVHVRRHVGAAVGVARRLEPEDVPRPARARDAIGRRSGNGSHDVPREMRRICSTTRCVP